jgi:hypothetical protein
VAVDRDTGARVVASRAELARESNRHLARSAARLRFVSRVPFLCECSKGDCQELVLLFLDDYDQGRSRPIIAPGHER